MTGLTIYTSPPNSNRVFIYAFATEGALSVPHGQESVLSALAVPVNYTEHAGAGRARASSPRSGTRQLENLFFVVISRRVLCR